MAKEINACRKSAELILGDRLRDANSEDVLGLLVVGICNLAIMRAKQRSTGKRISTKKPREISKLLYREVMRRMNQKPRKKSRPRQ